MCIPVSCELSGCQRGDKVPLVHMFNSQGMDFVLDLHTNKLFLLEAAETKVLQRWLNGEKLSFLSKEYPLEIERIRKLQEQGLFCCDKPQELAFRQGWKDLQKKVTLERECTIIEITQECNLRCKYCIFGGGFNDRRMHSSKRMSIDLLHKTIGEALRHGEKSETIFLGLYGGEPLSAFDLVESAVEYANKRSDKSVRFSMTTNATLLNKKMSRFLKDAEFSVLVSLDGPHWMHDRHRVFASGRGSYAATIKGLQVLLDCYGAELQHKIGLNMVVPTDTWIPHLEELWESEPWLPRSIQARVSLVDPPRGYVFPKPVLVEKRKSLKEEWFAAIENKEDPPTTLARETFDMPLARLHQRPIFRNPTASFFPNGCCIPGSRKVYVEVDGTYQICERVCGAPSIGSVERGIDLEQIRSIITEYTNQSFQDCRLCWAVSNCTLCFEHAYKDGRFNMNKKRKACLVMKESLSSQLKLYGLISQKYPHKLAEWESIEIG